MNPSKLGWFFRVLCFTETQKEVSMWVRDTVRQQCDPTATRDGDTGNLLSSQAQRSFCAGTGEALNSDSTFCETLQLKALSQSHTTSWAGPFAWKEQCSCLRVACAQLLEGEGCPKPLIELPAGPSYPTKYKMPFSLTGPLKYQLSASTTAPTRALSGDSHPHLW